MLGVFDAEKVIQAAGVLLKSVDPHRLSRLRLLTLLYIADRENFAHRGRPITGDTAVATDHGPMLSRIDSCIKGGDPASSQWEHFIQRSGPQDLELATDPGVGKLSRPEIARLQEISARYGHLNDYALATLTHAFPEWAKNQLTESISPPILIRDILEALGIDEYADEILAEVHAATTVQRRLAAVKVGNTLAIHLK